MSDNLDELISVANTANAEGRLDDAIRALEAILSSRPDDLQAMLLMGVVAVKQQRLDEALALLAQVTERDPNSFFGPYWMSMALRRQNQFTEALSMAELAVSRNDQQPTGLNQLGLCHLDLYQYQEAEACLRRAVKLAPTVSTIQENLARALQGLGRLQESARAFRLAIALDPTKVQVLGRLGNNLMNELSYEEAADCARQILAIEPHSVSGHLLLSRALIGTGKAPEALEHVERALEPAGPSPNVYSVHGSVLEALGRIDEANVQYQRSIELNPRQGFVYYALVRNHKVVEQDRPLIAQMEALLGDESVGRDDASYLHYALGKAREDLGEFELAMGHLDKANQLASETTTSFVGSGAPDAAQEVDYANAKIDSGFIEKNVWAGSDDETPVFVVGMMRSGTTLVEQILSSHPRIGGAGELRFWSLRSADPFEFPQLQVVPSKLQGLIQEYLDLLKELAPGMARVVDKMPSNYWRLGLIHVAFPNARIIHLKRHPVDTCLSMWATPKACPVEWRNQKARIVYQYEEYLRLMAHWRSVLPSDRLLNVQYEELVSDPEPITRQMIEFCGVEWDDACLRPEDNERQVNTPSVWQVRQPVYRSSVARWRKFEPWLGEFSALPSSDI